MSPSCLGTPADWARVLEVAARCSGVSVERAGELALVGAQVLIVPVAILVLAGVLLRFARR